MKKNAFTLIELLAVILILGIISLIAIPIVSKILDESRSKSFEITVNNISKAVTDKCNKDLIKGKGVINYFSIIDGQIDTDIGIKGELPDGDIYVDSKCGVTFNFKNKEFIGYKNNTNNKTVIIKNNESDNFKKLPKNISIGSPVYIDVNKGSICFSKDYDETKQEKNGCQKWHVYKNNGNNTYQLILSHNTSFTVKWNETGNASDGISTANNALNEDVSEWETDIKNSVRIITANEIAEITHNSDFNSNTSTSDKWFYFDSNNHDEIAINEGTSNYAWLYNKTHHCNEYGCNFESGKTRGYWTSNKVYNKETVWIIDRKGLLDEKETNNESYGIRPVITYGN